MICLRPVVGDPLSVLGLLLTCYVPGSMDPDDLIVPELLWLSEESLTRRSVLARAPIGPMLISVGSLVPSYPVSPPTTLEARWRPPSAVIPPGQALPTPAKALTFLPWMG